MLHAYIRAIYNQAVKHRLSTQKNPFAHIFTRNDKTIKRAVSEVTIVQIKNMDLTLHKELIVAFVGNHCASQRSFSRDYQRRNGTRKRIHYSHLFGIIWSIGCRYG